MAINTRSRRASAVAVMQPWGVLLPEPDATVGQEDRQHVAASYAGLAASAPAANADTSSKRGSALRVLRPYFPLLPIPDSTIGSVDRANLSLTYSGSSFTPPDPAAQINVEIDAAGVGTLLAYGTCTVAANGNAALSTPSIINEATVFITATASGDLLETTDPVFVVITATAGAANIATATCSVTTLCSAAGVLVNNAVCSVSITSAAHEAGGIAIGSGVGRADVAVTASAVGSYATNNPACDVAITASAVGTIIAFANSSIIVNSGAQGDDGVPDPTSGTATIVILCSAAGSIIAPSQPKTPVPTGRTIDFKSIADYYNRGLAAVPVYEFSGGRKFYEREL